MFCTLLEIMTFWMAPVKIKTYVMKHAKIKRLMDQTDFNHLYNNDQF